MMGSVLEPTEVKNTFEDLSGLAINPGKSENPYKALIEACHDDPAEIQAVYASHRERRHLQQKMKFLDLDFKELIIDPFLFRLENPHWEPGFKDTRHCMVLWARPPIHVLELAGAIQNMLKDIAPRLWLMPQYRMHLTSIELAFSRPAEDIEAIKETLKPAAQDIASHTYLHRTRLVKPMVSYDLSAFALSFLPSAGEEVVSPAPSEPDNANVLKHGDGYTYHHLRSDLWEKVTAAGVDIESRYVVPSAHITLGRFLSETDHATPDHRQRWVDAIDGINEWLRTKVWGITNDGYIGEWIVGQEKGLDLRVGTLWYGGGRTVISGEGF